MSGSTEWDGEATSLKAAVHYSVGDCKVVLPNPLPHCPSWLPTALLKVPARECVGVGVGKNTCIQVHSVHGWEVRGCGYVHP